MKVLHYILAFALEIAMLVAFGYWGFGGDKKPLEKYGMGLGLPLMAILLWWWWAAPKSTHRLDQPWLLLFKLALFGIAAWGLYRSGQPIWAYWLLGLAMLSIVVEYLWF